MTARYIDSNASGANDGTTWADAYANIATALAAPPTMGDVFYCSSGHAQSQAGNYTTPSTASYVANETLTFISVDATGSPEPPNETDYLRGASETVTAGYITLGATSDFINFVFIGFDFTYSNVLYCSSDNTFEFIDCEFDATAGAYFLYTYSQASVICRNCTFNAGNTTLEFPSVLGAHLELIDCTFTGSALVGPIFGKAGGGPTSIRGRGIDLSNCAAGVDLFTPCSSINYGSMVATLSGCKMPTSWSGDIVASAVLAPQERYEVFLVDDADTAIGMRIAAGGGTVVTDTSVYHTETYSLLMTGLASAATVAGSLPIWVEVGELYVEAATTTLEIRFTSTVVLNKSNFWFEIQSPDAATYPLQVFGRSRAMGDMIPGGTPGTYTAAATGWTGGKTFQYKYVHTIASSQAGMHRVFAYLASATNSHAVYIDPSITPA